MVFGFFGIGRGVALSTAGVGYYDVVISWVMLWFWEMVCDAFGCMVCGCSLSGYASDRGFWEYWSLWALDVNVDDRLQRKEERYGFGCTCIEPFSSTHGKRKQAALRLVVRLQFECAGICNVGFLRSWWVTSQSVHLGNFSSFLQIDENMFINNLMFLSFQSDGLAFFGEMAECHPYLPNPIPDYRLWVFGNSLGMVADSQRETASVPARFFFLLFFWRLDIWESR